MGANFYCNFYVPTADFSEVGLAKLVSKFYVANGLNELSPIAGFSRFDYDFHMAGNKKHRDTLELRIWRAEQLSKGLVNYNEFTNCWLVVSSITQEGFVGGFGGNSNQTKKAVLKNRGEFIELMGRLCVHIGALFGWADYEHNWYDRSSNDVLGGKIPTNNSYVFIPKKYVKKFKKADLAKAEYRKIGDWGILLYNRSREFSFSKFLTPPLAKGWESNESIIKYRIAYTLKAAPHLTAKELEEKWRDA